MCKNVVFNAPYVCDVFIYTVMYMHIIYLTHSIFELIILSERCNEQISFSTNRAGQ